ncbi:MAG: Beta-glucosidase A [Parcubacteria group bacterium GW2011_GWE2_39_37]|uniref:Beta-glucosidase A n=1 Tax=Candidatus Falkowbacteria bacterium GW2011_GWF2_39_8 TaxID=1618642 RepID=A0A0G0PX59_9BACT|nr:MAG: Beta-glucosidase A [Parcubacteria group bacterium GW2011_GWE2_39_37]KKR32503.1 MAG: Beta-glucosidase A [Candidatus Falkowbacteria bacterium GW2011_GWF2_39_8]
MSDKNILIFPKNFLWGAATSAYQVEGGITNEWSEWEKTNADRLAEEAKTYYQDWQLKKMPEILNRENYLSGQAADHYNRYKEDFVLVEKLNHNAHRLSLEWSRIQPEENKFDEKEIEHYREVLLDLKRRKIIVFLTIWHWLNPLWVRDQGGWENKKTISDFKKYVSRLAEEFGDLVDFWQPLNEPGTYIGMSYIQGSWPPQVRSFWRANKAFKNLMEAYRQSYQAIKQVKASAQVGMSHYAVYNIPYKNKLINRLLVKPIDYFRNWRFLDSIDKTNDFIGIQFYHTDHLNITWKFKFGRGRWGFLELKNPNQDVTDMNWDIYPEGLYHLIKRAAKYGKPIYVTENGLADKFDEKRTRFIKEHLIFIHRAISEGVDVRGYFHWSLLDNFEWDKGFWPRFGLVEVDYQTLERKIRNSALVYADICKNNYLEIE